MRKYRNVSEEEVEADLYLIDEPYKDSTHEIFSLIKNQMPIFEVIHD